MDEVRPARDSSISLPLLIPDCPCEACWIKSCKLPQIVKVDLQFIGYRRTTSKVDPNFFYLKDV